MIFLLSNLWILTDNVASASSLWVTASNVSYCYKLEFVNARATGHFLQFGLCNNSLFEHGVLLVWISKTPTFQWPHMYLNFLLVAFTNDTSVAQGALWFNKRRAPNKCRLQVIAASTTLIPVFNECNFPIDKFILRIVHKIIHSYGSNKSTTFISIWWFEYGSSQLFVDLYELYNGFFGACQLKSIGHECINQPSSPHFPHYSG